LPRIDFSHKLFIRIHCIIITCSTNEQRDSQSCNKCCLQQIRWTLGLPTTGQTVTQQRDGATGQGHEGDQVGKDVPHTQMGYARPSPESMLHFSLRIIVNRPGSFGHNLTTMTRHRD